jgi:hypothetical protein
VLVVGDTVMLLPVAPLLQLIVPPSQPVADNVTDSPVQMLFLDAVTVGAEPTVFTVIFTVFEAALVQSAILHFAVYSVVAIGDTVMLAPTVPFDHTTEPPSQPVAVKFTVSPAQSNVLGDAEIVGADGLPIVIVTGVELALMQFPILHIAV